VGRALIAAAEEWSREHGCTELASDAWLDGEVSQRAHAALGFEAVDRCVHYRKRIASAPPSPAGPAHHGPDLARIHHLHFEAVAEAAARELLGRLSRAGVSSGTIVDFACGSGVLARRVTEAGFEAWGVDLSEDMLRIARAEAPAARFVHGSLWSEALPRCVAVAAVGEAFCYAADPAAGLFALGARFQRIHEVLDRGGVFLFDVAGPGRSGPSGTRRMFWSYEDGALGFEEHEDSSFSLNRAITVFVPRGGLFERTHETHRLHLYGPEVVQGLLERAGFLAERLSGYDGLEVGPGWHAFAATKR
jgi:SAM-dependent methyltransferase